MFIHHSHHDHLASTQSELKKVVTFRATSSENTLISCNHQVDGVGRRGTAWQHYPHALAFSFTLEPSPVVTLTPLEVGIHLANYFSKHTKLKWPNDLLNDRYEKVGGIICQLYNKKILVGIGLNLYLSQQEQDQANYPYPIGSVYSDKKFSDNFKAKLPYQIYESILQNRLSADDIKRIWPNYCLHLDKKVCIQDGSSQQEGIFIGLGDNGEAILLDNNNVKTKILTGSLKILEK